MRKKIFFGGNKEIWGEIDIYIVFSDLVIKTGIMCNRSKNNRGGRLDLMYVMNSSGARCGAVAEDREALRTVCGTECTSMTLACWW